LIYKVTNLISSLATVGLLALIAVGLNSGSFAAPSPKVIVTYVQGPAGADGIDGIKGADGYGADGVDGANGSNGSNGFDGPNGKDAIIRDSTGPLNREAVDAYLAASDIYQEAVKAYIAAYDLYVKEYKENNLSAEKDYGIAEQAYRTAWDAYYVARLKYQRGKDA
jgi:hypothetical protein